MKVLIANPPKNKRNLLIKVSDTLFIDSYNGGSDWGTTENAKLAWRMTQPEAERRLPRVQIAFKNATIVKA